jgi:hypothetical protein
MLAEVKKRKEKAIKSSRHKAKPLENTFFLTLNANVRESLVMFLVTSFFVA